MTIITAAAQKQPHVTAPTLEQIRQNQQAISPWVLTTPVWPLQTAAKKSLIGSGDLFFKLELWQHTGTFKARGAITHLLKMPKEQLAKGITAVSAGNHAIATSYAAHCFNTHAKVLMPKSASSARVDKCREFGADVLFTDNMHELFDRVKIIQEQEGRTLIHPYEGPDVVLGTASCGAEMADQIPHLDAVIIAVGGGGLLAGAATAIKQIQPQCQVFGVEPYNANSMSLSFQKGEVQNASRLNSIADSLCAPHASEYSYSVCAQYAAGLVNVSDSEIIQAMHFAFNHLKLALEPATATTIAALMGPLHQQLQNKRVGILLCGTNTDPDTFCRQLNMQTQEQHEEITC